MRQALGGDETAYGLALKEVAGVIRAVARRRIGPSTGVDVEDVVQETLLAIHTKRHTWDPSAPLGPWVYAIMRYKIADQFRRRGKAITVDIETVIETLEAEAPETVSEREITRALDGLAEGQRRVVRAISVEGRTIGETAAAFGMQETAVRVALHRGLSAIAARFGKKT
jgi:RNA polymerase sigma-70 factor (ECF subfamily)